MASATKRTKLRRKKKDRRAGKVRKRLARKHGTKTLPKKAE